MTTQNNPTLNEYLEYVSRYSDADLENAFICDFRPDLSSFNSIDEARLDYAKFLMEQAEFFEQYYNGRYTQRQYLNI